MVSLKEWCIENNREDLLLGYDYETNPSPENIAKGSHTKTSWRCCNCGSRYLRNTHNINISTVNRCPVCLRKYISDARHQAAVKKTNFADSYPDLISEWDFTKNKLSPEQVSYNDNHQYYWTCKRCGHSYKSVIINRIKGSQCPHCIAIWHTSFPEQAIFYYLRKVFNDAILRDKSIGRELDIFIPSLNIGIEYDGLVWHKNKKSIENDKSKEQICLERGIKLIRVREKGLSDFKYLATAEVIYVKSGDEVELEEAIRSIFNILQTNQVDVDINRDRNIILSNFISAKKDNSLKTRFPELVKEWNYEKNYPIKPENIDYGSGFVAWWKCSVCSYEFQATVNARTCKGSGCPACCNLVLFKGHNDFLSWCHTNNRTDLLQQWDYERNRAEGIDIGKIINRGGSIRANWICERGHRYKQLVYDRTINKGCPICAKARRFKKCRNLDTGEIFNSIKEAGEAYHISPSKISLACQGKRPTACGFRWEYITR